MHRRDFIALSSAALAGAPWWSVGAHAQQPTPAQQPAQPKFEAIRGNVGYFTARGGTIGWYIGKDAVVTVDTQFPDTARLCVDGLRERAGGRVIDLAFNTHHHGDHTGGNAIFREAAKKLVAHVRVPELQKSVGQPPPGTATPPPAPVVADTTFDEKWTETVGDEQVTARHYGPGHTGGDAVVHFEKAQVIHMGDLFFHELHPRVDRPGGASIRNWMRTLDAVAKEMDAATIYIAGHARPGLPVTTGRKELLGLRDYFEAVLNATQQAISKGHSKAELTKLPALPGFEQYQSSGTILTLAGTLGAAYDELSQR
ncbi:MAG TPA: MBL fold metallo-hydrolase [Vicinamibacterales bacterium]|nr:MBL fold metallo-hydrolase [Vicinamibacterales bacterium]